MAEKRKLGITIWRLIRSTASRFKAADPIVFAAAIAFFTIFSLPPTLMIVVAIVGKIVDEQAVEGEISEQIGDLIGPESAAQVEEMLRNVEAPETGFIFSLIGIVTLLFSATVVFNFIQKALNSIWGVKPKPKKGAVKFLIDRILSFSMVILLGILLFASLIIDAALALLHNYLSRILSDEAAIVIQTLNFCISFSVVTVIFALMFKFLPDARVKWRDVWIGAFVTAILFEFGKIIIGVILAQTNIASAYGAAGSLAAILLWVFYSTVILLIGAEFTYVYSKMQGRVIKPRKQAVSVEVKEVEYKDDE